MRRLTARLAGMVKLTPLKATALLDCRSPGTPAGAGPEPLSTVSETSVVFVPDNRLVTLTFRKTTRLSVIVVTAGPPELVRRISTRVSGMPSARTAGVTAPVAQVRGEDWDRAMPAHEIRAAHTKNKRIKIGLLKKERGCHKNILGLAGLSIRAAPPCRCA